MTTDAPEPRLLEELAADWASLETGVHYPVAANFCTYCHSTDLYLVVKLRVNPNASLAGAMPKVSARPWPYLHCNGCGHESAGKRD